MGIYLLNVLIPQRHFPKPNPVIPQKRKEWKLARYSFPAVFEPCFFLPVEGFRGKNQCRYENRANGPVFPFGPLEIDPGRHQLPPRGRKGFYWPRCPQNQDSSCPEVPAGELSQSPF